MSSYIQVLLTKKFPSELLESIYFKWASSSFKLVARWYEGTPPTRMVT